MGIIDLFKPKWRHSDPAVRREAVEALDNQSSLITVAKSDPDPAIRQLALEKIDLSKLHDKTLVAQIIQGDSSGVSIPNPNKSSKFPTLANWWWYTPPTKPDKNLVQ